MKPIRSAFEEKAQKMADGFRGMSPSVPQLVFRNETLVPAQAADRLQEALNAFERIRDAEEAHRTAVETAHRGMRDFQSFYDEAVIVVKAHFGSDAKRLAGFGLGPAKPSRRRGRRGAREVIRTTVVEELTGRGEPIVEVVEEEVVVETSAPRTGRRMEKAPRAAAVPPVNVAAPAVAASTAGIAPTATLKSPSSKRSKSKRGSRS